jgi:hypothetical protein
MISAAAAADEGEKSGTMMTMTMKPFMRVAAAAA